jgi:hypothetical protein
MGAAVARACAVSVGFAPSGIWIRAGKRWRLLSTSCFCICSFCPLQGIDDLAAPLYAVFLSPWAGLDGVGLEAVDPLVLADVEGDVYWCLTKLLDGIQDHFTPSQPGIQRMIFRLRELVHRIDGARTMRDV